MLLHIKGQAKTTMTNVDEQMEQMHAVDVRIDKLYELHGDFAISEDIKVHRHQVEVHPDETGWFTLKPNTAYAFDTTHEVEMAEGEAGWIISRSTLTRNGLAALSALYDSGYIGGVNGQLQNNSLHKARIKRDTRIGQFIVVKADTVKLYEGDYNEAKDGSNIPIQLEEKPEN